MSAESETSHVAKLSSQRPSGEVWVWVTSVGLTIGLGMILILLGWIFLNGTSFFFPKRVVLLEFEESGQTRFQGEARALGIITRTDALLEGDLVGERAHLLERSLEDPRYLQEYRVYLGNRDAFGRSFQYFNRGETVSLTYPEEVMVLERMSWGDALVFPLSLELPDGDVIAADDERFDGEFRRMLREVNRRRGEINRIDRVDIGRISSRIRRNELAITYWLTVEDRTPEQEATIVRLREEIAEWNHEMEPLLEESRRLASLQGLSHFRYRLIDGSEHRTPMGNLVSAYYPNQLGWFGRLSHAVVQFVRFVSEPPREANTEGGIWPALFGTFVMTLIMSAAVVPFGVIAAIYLREYARQGPVVRAVRISINNLAGVPSIVFGVFGLGFFVLTMGNFIDEWFFPRMAAIDESVFSSGGILWASLTLALMTLPVVIVATEEALAAVPRGVREGALACGASKWQAIRSIVLPASTPGILTGLILAMARGAGEVAPLILVGVVAMASNLPIDGEFPFIHLNRQFEHLGFTIYSLAQQTQDSEAMRPRLYAATMVLILLVILLNLAAIVIRNRLRKKYLASTF